MDLEIICKQTIDAVKTTGNFIMESFEKKDRLKIEEKGKHNFVTETDKKAEELLVGQLQKVLPEAGFIAEEGTSTSRGKKYNWVIDPIDGTTNFIHGSFPFAVSVALAEEDEPIVGVVLEFGRNECFYAWKSGGAYLDGKPIRVSGAKTMHDSLIATGFPYTNYSRIDGFMDSIVWIMKNSQGMRRLGSAATDIVWVACGRYDGFYEYGLSPWDIAAGMIIVKEAGGKYANFKGKENCLFDEEFICSNGLNHKEFIDVIHSFMY